MLNAAAWTARAFSFSAPQLSGASGRTLIAQGRWDMIMHDLPRFGLVHVVIGTCIAVSGAVDYPFGYVASSWYPSGALAPWGRDMRLATEMAVADVNRENRLGRGSRLVIPEGGGVYESNGTTGAQLAAAAETMAGELGVFAVLGADWTRVATQLARKDGSFWPNWGLPLITGGSTAASLDSVDVFPGLFRTSYSDGTVVPSLARVVSALSLDSAAVVGSTDPFGWDGVVAANRTLRALGIDVRAVEAFDSSDANGRLRGDNCADRSNYEYVRNVIRPALFSGARALFISGTGPSTQCVLSALAREAPPRFAVVLSTEVIHPSSSAADGFFDDVVAGAEGYMSYLGAPYTLTSEYATFARRFDEQFGHSPDSWAPHAYDAVLLLAEALRVCADESAPNALEPGSDCLVRALREVKMFGVTGKIEFGVKATTPVHRRVGLWRFRAPNGASVDENGILSHDNFERVGTTREPDAHADAGVAPGFDLYYEGLKDIVATLCEGSCQVQ